MGRRVFALFVYAFFVLKMNSLHGADDLVETPVPLATFKWKEPLELVFLPISVRGRNGETKDLRAFLGSTSAQSLWIDSKRADVVDTLGEPIGTETIDMDIARYDGKRFSNFTLSVGKGVVSTDNLPATVFDFDEYRRYAAIELDALISLQHFRGYAVQFDADAKEVRFFRAADFPMDDDAIPLKFDEYLELPVSLSPASTTPCTINLAALVPLRLPYSIAAELSNTGQLSDTRLIRRTSPSGAPMNAVISTMRSLRLGDARIDSVRTLSQETSRLPMPALGIGLLMQTQFTFVLGEKPSMILRPLKGRPPTPHPMDMIGIDHRFDGSSLVVLLVEEESPAVVAGVRPGDKIATVNGVPVAELGRYRIRKIFADTTKECALKVQRGKKEFEVRLTPREFRPLYKFKPVDKREIPLDD